MNTARSALTTALEREADRAGAPEVDLASVYTQGGRRRRRRTALMAGGSTLAAAAVLGTILLAPWSSPEDRIVQPATPTSAWDPSTLYGVGTQLHVDGRTIATPTPVHNLVPTTAGAVYVDPDGDVWNVDDAGQATQVGSTSSETPYLFGDVEHVGWTAQRTKGEPLTAHVLDVATQQVRSIELTHPDVVTNAPLQLLDVSSGLLSMATGNTIVQVPLTEPAAEPTVLRGEDGFELWGARGDTVLSGRADEATLLVGSRPGEGTPVTPIGQPILSPDGSRVLSFSDEGVVAVADVDGTQWDVTPVPGAELGPFAWVDDDTWLAIAFPLDGPEGEDEDAPLDLMRCTVPSGPTVTCEVAVKGFSSITQGFAVIGGMINY